MFSIKLLFYLTAVYAVKAFEDRATVRSINAVPDLAYSKNKNIMIPLEKWEIFTTISLDDEIQLTFLKTTVDLLTNNIKNNYNEQLQVATALNVDEQFRALTRNYDKLLLILESLPEVENSQELRGNHVIKYANILGASAYLQANDKKLVTDKDVKTVVFTNSLYALKNHHEANRRRLSDVIGVMFEMKPVSDSETDFLRLRMYALTVARETIISATEIIKEITEAIKEKEFFISTEFKQLLKTEDYQRVSELLSLPFNASLLQFATDKKLAQCEIRYYQKKIIIQLRVPVTFENLYNSYAILPFPTVLNQQTVAYIKPNFDYLLISKLSKKKYLVTEKQLKNCIEHEKFKYCKHYKEFVTDEKCESLLFPDKNKPQFKNCNVIQEEMENHYVIKTTQPNLWLFTFKNQSQIRVQCPYLMQCLTVEGSDILDLPNNCTVNLDGHSFVGGEGLPAESIKIPNLQLTVANDSKSAKIQIFPINITNIEKKHNYFPLSPENITLIKHISIIVIICASSVIILSLINIICSKKKQNSAATEIRCNVVSNHVRLDPDINCQFSAAELAQANSNNAQISTFSINVTQENSQSATTSSEANHYEEVGKNAKAKKKEYKKIIQITVRNIYDNHMYSTPTFPPRRVKQRNKRLFNRKYLSIIPEIPPPNSLGTHNYENIPPLAQNACVNEIEPNIVYVPMHSVKLSNINNNSEYVTMLNQVENKTED